MRVWVLAGLLFSLILLAGCAEKECKTATDCVEKTCSAVDCRDNSCVYSPVSGCCGNELCEVGEVYSDCAADCPNCDDSNDCTTDSYDFYEQACVNEIISQCCGNGMCEIGIEAYENCPADCPNCDDDSECTKDSFDYHEQKCVHSPIPGIVCCGNGICEVEEAYEACPIDCPSCDDENECTEDSFDYHKQKCVNELITPCCGNDICDESAEDYSSCTADCPDCDDSDRMTGDSFNYASQECEYVTYYLYEDFEEGIFPWGTDPRWAVAGGMLSKVAEAEYAYSGFGDQSWDDYTFRVGVRLEEGFVEMNFRNSGEKGSYALLIQGTTLSLIREEGKDRVSFGTAKHSFDPATFYDVSVELKGSSIKVYVDDALLIDATEPSPLLAGNLGLYISDKAYFDEVIVEALE